MGFGESIALQLQSYQAALERGTWGGESYWYGRLARGKPH